jgi:sigma-B regulation protein RsbU (phosphoserine phosphatase)
VGQEPSPEALALLDSAACGLFRTQEDGGFLRVNRLFCSWVGYSAEALVGKRRFQDLLTMGGRIFHQTHWAPLLRMQGSVSEVKFEVLHVDGTAMPMVLNAVRRVEGGAVVHDIAAFVARDRDTYERELVQSRRRLEEVVAEKTRLEAQAKDRASFAEQMIGIVSHDLRNPLSSISLGTAVLSRGEATEGQKRTLSRIARSTERATRLIGDLLDFTQARLGAGLAVTLDAVDLHQAVAQAVDELSAIYPGRVLKHERSGSGGCQADANRLAQLVGNLVSNAMAYGSPEAPVTITSRIEGRTCSISVHNEGVPIPEAAALRIFQPMARGEHTTNTQRSVGLGLFIVREIARAHGGDARVSSSAEGGTTFTIEFTCAQ